MRRFSASYDLLTKIVSGVLLAVVAGVGLLSGSLLISLGLVALLGLTFLWSPLGYEVEPGLLTVRRPIGPARIALNELRESRLTQSDDLTGCIRLFGSGGLFGYFGLFRTSKLGKCTWYCTSRENMVVLITPSKTVVLSPDDPAALLDVVSHVPGTGGGSSSRRPAGRAPMIIGVSLAALALGVVALAFSYSPGPPRYTLTRDSLTIHDRFYPVTVSAADVDLAAARAIELSADSEWRPTLRTNGFANTHYQSGWFQVARGDKVRMYRAAGKRLVLLPPKANGVPILYQAADPDAFLAELRRAWAAPPL